MIAQRGGFALGLIVGLLAGLVLALGVALYVTKVPVPFVNKVPQRTAEQDAAETERNKNWDPNAPLANKPAVKSGAAPTASQPAPAATPPAAAAPTTVATRPATALGSSVAAARTGVRISRELRAGRWIGANHPRRIRHDTFHNHDDAHDRFGAGFRALAFHVARGAGRFEAFRETPGTGGRRRECHTR